MDRARDSKTNVLLLRTGRGQQLTPDLMQICSRLGYEAGAGEYLRTIDQMMVFADSNRPKPALVLATGILTGHNLSCTAIEVDVSDLIKHLASSWGATLEFVPYA